MKPLGKVSTRWSDDLAYVIGLIVSDGNLSKDGRHILFTSKDYDLAASYKEALNLGVIIGKKGNGSNPQKRYHVVQFGDKLFYNFLLSLGITPKKSKTLGSVKIPRKYFYHYLRGCYDGDGHFYSYWDKRWKSSYMYYLGITSASLSHILWLREKLNFLLDTKGHITRHGKGSAYQLKFGKKESLIILRKIYPTSSVRCLSRKRLKIERALAIINEKLS